MKPTLPEQIPPYGAMWKDFERYGASTDEKPKAWRGDLEHWKAWMAAMKTRIANSFWPSYSEAGIWVGDSRDLMIPLTELELDLIIRFQSQHFDRAAVPGDALSPTHARLFRDEDQGSFHKTLFQYAPALKARETDLKKLEDEEVSAKVRVMDLQLKRPFQRPRAYQMSRLFEKPLTYYYALWAFTPSLLSAHALHSAILGCCVFESLNQTDPALAAAHRPAIQQWSMDIGDRRIMAGVHYPMDSMASMVVALEACEHIFAEAETRRFLAEAVQTKSRSYQLLGQLIHQGGGVAKTLESGWRAVEWALERASAEGRTVGPGDQGVAASAGHSRHPMAEVRGKDDHSAPAR